MPDQLFAICLQTTLPLSNVVQVYSQLTTVTYIIICKPLKPSTFGAVTHVTTLHQEPSNLSFCASPTSHALLLAAPAQPIKKGKTKSLVTSCFYCKRQAIRRRTACRRLSLFRVFPNTCSRCTLRRVPGYLPNPSKSTATPMTTCHPTYDNNSHPS